MTTISKPVVVVTGFEPFGERKKVNLNASWTVADYIRKKRTGNKKVELKAMELKVAWGPIYDLGLASSIMYAKEILTTRDPLIYNPDIWIAFGEDEKSKQFQIELKADPKNFWTKKMLLNIGHQEQKAEEYAIPPDVKNKYPEKDERWNSLQLCADLARRLNRKGYPSVIDHRAGGYICEQMLYTLLSTRTGTKKLSLFIHVPIETDVLVAENGKEFPNDETRLGRFGVEVFDYVVGTLYPKI